ncbi:hypothetical protein Mar181_0338 [Marinomonas posidonica IVIA-Po-181]|uniref:Uncharacterized protein n=1 Tax=Marinomonas posidonica (strain CECT 7376 / NCIMB 14433 / IVIA-Po-181) TaxID=491952 RepID=F6CY76_MARPP|nr:hypothetical protein Mar181_0338 [Marinomonas posidonica IVIA-Po-181]
MKVRFIVQEQDNPKNIRECFFNDKTTNDSRWLKTLKTDIILLALSP